jgi:hypothetical protein
MVPVNALCDRTAPFGMGMWPSTRRGVLCFLTMADHPVPART